MLEYYLLCFTQTWKFFPTPTVVKLGFHRLISLTRASLSY